MTRQQANLKILSILTDYFTKNPDVRFIQGLWNLGIICWNDTSDCILDLFHQESVDTLADVEIEKSKMRLTEYPKE